MLHFMSENKRILNLHENKCSDLENFQANITVFQTNTNSSFKNLETQIGQLAQAVQKEPKESFPSDTRKNPKDCMAVILRSGRELDERRVEMRNIEEEKQSEIGEELEQHSSGTTEKKKIIEMQPNQQGKKEDVKAYNPLVLFPQRLHKANLDEQFSTFLNMFKKIEINILSEALTQMPQYAKFMKDILKKEEDY